MSATSWIPDHSALACFRENPEAFRLKYRLHLQPATPDDKMQAGSALHAARNVLFSARKQGVQTYTPELIDGAVRAARELRGDGGGARNADQVEQVVRAYAALYATEPFEVVQTEEYSEARIHEALCASNDPSSFGAPACSCASFAYCGILDALVRFPDGSVYVMDLKSTGAYLNENWTALMRIGDQFTGYVALCRALGLRCDGYFVDGIRLNDYIRKGETVPRVDLERDFARVGPVQVPEWRVERWARDVQFTLAQIAELERTRGLDTPWPVYQNWPYGKVDVYRDFYEQPSELHASTAQLFERRAWNPREVAEGRKVSV